MPHIEDLFEDVGGSTHQAQLGFDLNLFLEENGVWLSMSEGCRERIARARIPTRFQLEIAFLRQKVPEANEVDVRTALKSAMRLGMHAPHFLHVLLLQRRKQAQYLRDEVQHTAGYILVGRELVFINARWDMDSCFVDLSTDEILRQKDSRLWVTYAL